MRKLLIAAVVQFAVLGVACSSSNTSSPEEVKESLIVNATGLGNGSISSDPAGIECTVTSGNVGSTGCAVEFPAGSQVTLSAVPASGSIFIEWSGDCTGSGDCTVALDQARTVVASFGVVHTVTVLGAGTGTGHVSSAPIGIDCEITAGSPGLTGCVADFLPGGLQLTALAAPGDVFAGWGGDCTGTGSCVLALDQAQTVTASFNQGPPPVIAFNSSISSGVADCPLPATGPGARAPTFVRLKFDYTDADGDVTAGAIVTDDATWVSGGSSQVMVFTTPTVTGDGASGTVTVEMCVRGDAGTNVEHHVTLSDAGGHVSNQVTTTTLLY